jgi:PAS domain S-box-containing protein
MDDGQYGNGERIVENSRWSKRILLVEDNPDHGLLIKTRLKRLDDSFKVEIIETGEETLQTIEEKDYDLILSDYELPGMNGIEMLQKLRTKGITTPCIFLTGQGSEQIAIEALRAGASDYFTKEEGLARYERLVNSINKAINKVFMEREIIEYRRFLETIIDTIPDPIFIKDRNHRFVVINQSFCILVGRRREDMLQRSDYDFFPREEADFFWEKDEEMFETGANVEIPEEPITDSEGKLHLLNTMKVPLKDSEGKITHLVGIIRDITERKSIDEALKHREEQLRLIIENTMDVIYSARADGTITYISPQIIHWGALPQDIIGRNIMEFIHPDDVSKILEDFELTIRTGKEFTSRFKLAAPSGKMIDVEEYGKAIYEQGQVVQITGVIRDISGRITDQARESRERQEMERQAMKFVSLVENSTEFIAMADLEGNVLYVNSAGQRLVGLDSAEAAMAKKITDFVVEDHKTLLQKVIVPEVREKGTWEGEGTICHFKTGRSIDVSVTTFLVRDVRTGEPLCLATIIRDITERKQAHEELKKRNREMEGFIHAVSHDLKTPLVSINEFTEIALREKSVQESADARFALERVQANSHRVLEMIKGLQKYAHYTTRRENFERLSLGSIVREVAADISANRDLSSLKIVIQEDWPEILGEHMAIYQIFANLFSNAMKYGAKTIEASWKEERDFYRIRVRDDGIGIEEEFLDKVFDVFARSPRVAPETEGAGIGLAIVKKALERHGGIIWVESALGEGTTFFLTLPVPQPDVDEMRREVTDESGS